MLGSRRTQARPHSQRANVHGWSASRVPTFERSARPADLPTSLSWSVGRRRRAARTGPPPQLRLRLLPGSRHVHAGNRVRTPAEGRRPARRLPVPGAGRPAWRLDRFAMDPTPGSHDRRGPRGPWRRRAAGRRLGGARAGAPQRRQLPVQCREHLPGGGALVALLGKQVATGPARGWSRSGRDRRPIDDGDQLTGLCGPARCAFDATRVPRRATSR